MKKFIVCCIMCIGCLFISASCCHGIGWWLGIKPEPLPQRIIINKIGLKKIELKSNTDLIFYKLFLAYKERNDYMDFPRDFMTSIFGYKYIFHYEKITFANIQYHIGLDDNKNIIFVENNSPQKIVKKLSLLSSKAIYTFTPLTLKFEGKNYLVMSIQNMSRTNSSILLILDEQLNIVYKEYNLYNYEIGLYNDKQYGDCLIMKTGKFHPPKERKSEDEKYWLYYLPKEVQEDPSESDHSAIRERTAL